MSQVMIPDGFNGAKFARKFNLDHFTDFVLRPGGILDVPSLPDLTESDLTDCVGAEELPPSLDEFIEAFAESEKGNKQKMKNLLERYERTKK